MLKLNGKKMEVIEELTLVEKKKIVLDKIDTVLTTF